MAIVDKVKESVSRAFPRKDEDQPPDTSHLGYGNSLERPFDDDLILSKPAIVCHAIEAFFSFLAMACFASLASFQARFNVGPSGLTGFAIFVSVVDLVLALFIIAVPVIYDKFNKLNRLARAMNEERVQFILLGTGAVTSLLMSFVVTISAWTEPGCKNPKSDPNAKQAGDAFVNGLPGWCSTKKAGAIFLWIAFAAWIGSVIVAFLAWRQGKSNRPRDPPFRHPTDPSGYAPSLRTAEAADYNDEYDDDDDDPFRYPGDRRRQPAAAASGPAPISMNAGVRQSAAGEGVPQLPPFRTQTPGMTLGESPFSDNYQYRVPPGGPAPGNGVGGFTSPPPPAAIAPPPSSSGTGTPGVSRTMQYADPYAAIKANLASGYR